VSSEKLFFIDDLLDSMSHKTEDVILFLEDKLSELKAKTLSFKK
jgi:hypothetical protein